MGKLFLFMNVSLDGYVADRNHDISAFQTRDSKFEAFQQKQGKGAGTILLGRKTYAMMQQFWPTLMAAQMMPEVAAYMNATPKLVVSHTDFAPAWENTTVISGNVVEQLRRYKSEMTDDIIILGSNNLGVTLWQAGLLDEIQLVLNPVVLGGGTPLFAGLPQTELTLKETLQFASGKLLLTYVPPVKQHNAESLAALDELEGGRGKRAASVDELFADLEAA